MAQLNENRPYTSSPFAGQQGPQKAAAQNTQAQAKALTPLQQKLAELEKKLPGGMAARGIALAMVLAALLGVGGLKLNSYYRQTQDLFVTGVNTNDEQGATMMDELNSVVYEAAKSIQQAKRSSNSTVQAAADAANTSLQKLETAMESGSPAKMYAANKELYQTMDALKGACENTGTEISATGFFSHQNILSHMQYNDVAAAYNRTAESFPANIIGSLWGCGEVELFA